GGTEQVAERAVLLFVAVRLSQSQVMTPEAHLWFIRHAEVDGPLGIIHDIDAPADITDTAPFDTVRAHLPSTHSAFCSPARRAWETAIALGLEPVRLQALREQSFGTWTGRRHDDLAE